MKKLKHIWSRVAPVVGRLPGRTAEVLGTYLDDLLLLAAGMCFVLAALELLGRPWALVTAGVCLAVYAVVVARSRRGGGG